MKIKFLEQEYDEADLKALGIDQLLELRNLVASNLGASAIRSFPNHDTAVAQTLKALTKYAEESAKDPAPQAEVKKTKEPKEPKVRGLAKPAESQFVKRPTRKMFAKVEIIAQHTGKEDRAHRWPNYKDGMLIIDAIEGEGTLAWDIYNWEEKGLMKVHQPTDEEYKERRAAYFTKKGVPDPDLAKITKAEEAAAKKAANKEAAEKRKAEAAEKKAAAEKAKADAAAAKKAEADAAVAKPADEATAS
jgi:hypothetical protein